MKCPWKLNVPKELRTDDACFCVEPPGRGRCVMAGETAAVARALHASMARTQSPKALYSGDCRGCGECCSRFLPLTVADRVRIGRFVSSNGVRQRPERPGTVDLMCPYLTDGRECAIYEARPQICKAYRCDLHAGGDYRPMARLSWKSVRQCDMREEFGGDA